MIKLKKARIEEVRGIRRLDIDFEQATFAISGPNGSGKSGVINAIEFGLTGAIGRLAGPGTKGLSVAEHGPHVDIADCVPTRYNAYRRDHEQEFEVDLHSILGATNENDRYSLFIGGSTFLLHLRVFETVTEAIDPDFGKVLTHPPIMDRFQRLVDYFKSIESFQIEQTDTIVNYYKDQAGELVKRHSIQPDLFTRYGSIYLAEWQGPPLIDRVDY